MSAPPRKPLGCLGAILTAASMGAAGLVPPWVARVHRGGQTVRGAVAARRALSRNRLATAERRHASAPMAAAHVTFCLLPAMILTLVTVFRAGGLHLQPSSDARWQLCGILIVAVGLTLSDAQSRRLWLAARSPACLDVRWRPARRGRVRAPQEAGSLARGASDRPATPRPNVPPCEPPPPDRRQPAPGASGQVKSHEGPPGTSSGIGRSAGLGGPRVRSACDVSHLCRPGIVLPGAATACPAPQPGPPQGRPSRRAPRPASMRTGGGACGC